MSRCRNIKPALFENELLGQLDGDTVLTFIGSWCIADRLGRLEDRPLRIKGKLFPYRQVNIENALSQLERDGFLIRYTVNGKAFIQIVNFLKHQHPHHKEQESEIPPPPENLLTKVGRSTDLAPTKAGSCPSDSLIPHTDSLIPHTDSLIPHTFKGASPSGDQGESVDPNSEVKASRRKSKASPECDPDFLMFWEEYPRKVNRPAAYTAWSKAKLPAIADIIAAITSQSASDQWQKEGGKFIPHPTTWIAGERWNDQVAITNKEKSSHEW